MDIPYPDPIIFFNHIKHVRENFGELIAPIVSLGLPVNLKSVMCIQRI